MCYLVFLQGNVERLVNLLIIEIEAVDDAEGRQEGEREEWREGGTAGGRDGGREGRRGGRRGDSGKMLNGYTL